MFLFEVTVEAAHKGPGRGHPQGVIPSEPRGILKGPAQNPKKAQGAQ